MNGMWSGFHTFAVLVGVLLPIRRLQDGLKNDLKRPMEFAGGFTTLTDFDVMPIDVFS